MTLARTSLLLLLLAGCAFQTDPGTVRDPTAFDRAPSRPADYDASALPPAFSGLNEFNYLGAPEPAVVPEPPLMDKSQRLQTLEVLSVGLTVEMFRQGDVWSEVKKATDFSSNVLPPPESERYKYSGDPGVYGKRLADVLELVLKPMVEAWPIPTATIYESPKKEMDPELKQIFWDSIDNMRMPAGLHWSQIKQLGVVYSDTPEDVVEEIFRTFERYPDMPALLVYAEGPSGHYRNLQRVPDAQIASNAALVVARRERVEWLRPWAPYTKMGEDTIYPGFWKWDRQPPRPFKPTHFFPTPWTVGHFKQWDALPTLAQLHRPVVASLVDEHGAALKRKDRQASLLRAWTAVNDSAVPARVFFDAGKPGAGIAELSPLLAATGSELDLLDPQEGIDLAARLGDTGAASPFVQLVLATMATAESGKPSVVVPLRRADQATFLLLTPPAKKPGDKAFEVRLLPQISTAPDLPPPEPAQERSEPTTTYLDPEKVAAEKRILDDWLNSLPLPPDGTKG